LSVRYVARGLRSQSGCDDGDGGDDDTDVRDDIRAGGQTLNRTVCAIPTRFAVACESLSVCVVNTRSSVLALAGVTEVEALPDIIEGRRIAGEERGEFTFVARKTARARAKRERRTELKARPTVLTDELDAAEHEIGISREFAVVTPIAGGTRALVRSVLHAVLLQVRVPKATSA